MQFLDISDMMSVGEEKCTEILHCFSRKLNNKNNKMANDHKELLKTYKRSSAKVRLYCCEVKSKKIWNGRDPCS